MSLNAAGTVAQDGPEPTSQTTLTPHNQQPLVTKTYPSEGELDQLIVKSAAAQEKWARVPLQQRIAIGRAFMEEFGKMREEIPMELTLQMGRPVSQVPGEVRGTLDRADYMLSIAEKTLGDVTLEDTDKPGFRRFIRRAPMGVVLVVAPWNYPYLVMVNSVLPALISGNSVILKPSPQTPLSAERFAAAFHAAGVPKDVIQVVHLSPKLTTQAVAHKLVDFVAFTGSVAGGRAIDIAAAQAKGFKGVGLELGGKDPAYVRADADLDYTVAELVDGAFFNSGQSCCAIERIYVHESIYDAFVEKFVELTKKYKLGDPTKPETNIGPVCGVASAERIRKQVADAVAAGAKALIPEDLFHAAKAGTAYVAPQVLVDVNHTMEVMMEETFGPVVGIQKVVSDEQAIALMNDSPYGLTASVWTNAAANPESQDVFLTFVDELQTGTVFLNRCDALDPALAWTGVKDSGRGVSLSKFGYDQLTRAKSVHMKIKTA
ncbi:succinate semialdehyde dehydrogenase [Epithele typhae]|uniref:succinate semialdehyde dehydrogenase n=1 Tax=Epithele typhae TaxID=378194 RepID=UPI0020089B6B|nr:succinate semialdehyde dehydrogenase [Epithele typhae]KAH9939716.1 succinate semialdehyde dehydrogenase [Epithele typhae]